MTQEEAAHYCATVMIRALDMRPEIAQGFVYKWKQEPFLLCWRGAPGETDDMREGMVPIYRLHAPKYGKGDFNGRGANYTWSLVMRHLEEFAAQMDGNQWKIQPREKTTAFLRSTREALRGKFTTQR